MPRSSQRQKLAGKRTSGRSNLGESITISAAFRSQKISPCNVSLPPV
jgi:hypothetical protein